MYLSVAPEVWLWDTLPPVTPTGRLNTNLCLGLCPRVSFGSKFRLLFVLLAVMQSAKKWSGGPVFYCKGAKQSLTSIQIFLNQFCIIVPGCR